MPNVKELHINGRNHAIDANPDRTLLDVLRSDLSLGGAKYGCGEGKCGACTVLIDGKAIRSCKTRVNAAQGKKIETIEGLAQGETLHPLQAAFLKHGSLQCGYCTPGMIMSAVALLRDTPEPTREEVIREMNGNICRCGTYNRIIAAIQTAGKSMKAGAK
jgi:aerobic-type carbon monoxide dehydrogenase small subunit (CoxS/CutS family)